MEKAQEKRHGPLVGGGGGGALTPSPWRSGQTTATATVTAVAEPSVRARKLSWGPQ